MSGRALCFLAGVVAAGALAGADLIEITRSNGEIVVGDLVDEHADRYVVLRTLIERTSRVTYQVTIPKSDVTAITRPDDEYTKRAAAAGDAGQGMLAKWCFDRAMIARADEHALRAVAVDPRNADGRAVMAALGYVEADGVWLKADDWMAKRGLVRFLGRVMTPAQRLGLGKVYAQRDADQAEATAKQAPVSAADGAIARAQGRVAALARERSDQQQRAKGVQAVLPRLTEASQKLSAAEDVLRKADEDYRKALQRPAPRPGEKAPVPSTAELDRARDGQKRAQREHEQAQVAVRDAERAAAAARARLPVIDQEEAAAKAEIDRQLTVRAAAQQAQQAAKATAVQSEQTARTAIYDIPEPADLPEQLKRPPRP